MKKMLISIICIVMVFSLLACGSSTPQSNNKTITSDQSVDSVKSETKTKKQEENKDAKNKEITLHFEFGDRTGKYTGPLNENGLPEGNGSFTSQNEQGAKWTYTGEFVNGQFEGEGRTDWANAFEKGTYHNGKIVPLELSNSLYHKIISNPDEYTGNVVCFMGEVFNIVGYDEDDYVHFQVYSDAENLDNAVYAYAYLENELNENDYVRITGRVDGLYEGENYMGGTIYNVQVGVSECEMVSYTDVMSKTVETIDVNDTQTQNGYSVTVQKIEFSENETRIYIKVENNGKSKFSINKYDCEVVQNNQQYSYQSNWKADYPEIVDGLRPGNISEGIIAFPALEITDFKLYINGASEDWDEHFDEMEFNIKVEE